MWFEIVSDPGNEEIEFENVIDICSLIKVEEVMKANKLGPNGALVYCMEFLYHHFDWLSKKLEKLENNVYLLFDFPGQVNYSHIFIFFK